jgi:hypothetical protein
MYHIILLLLPLLSLYRLTKKLDEHQSTFNIDCPIILSKITKEQR